MQARVAAAVWIRGDRFLLCHRRPDREDHPDVWDLAGGHIEDGETPRDAVARELLEELAIDVFGTVGEAWTTISVDDIEMTIFAIDTWKGSVANNEPLEHDALAWFRLDQLPSLRLASPQYLDLIPRLLADRAGKA